MTAMLSTNRFILRMALAIGTVAALAMLSSCNREPTVWKKDALAPGGAWIATAQTRQWGGFGTDWVETTVSVKKLDGTVNHGKPFDVFSYPGGGKIAKAYVLSDENADTDLQLNWLSPTVLQISHRSDINPTLVVVRFADIGISYQ